MDAANKITRFEWAMLTAIVASVVTAAVGGIWVLSAVLDVLTEASR